MSKYAPLQCNWDLHQRGYFDVVTLMIKMHLTLYSMMSLMLTYYYYVIKDSDLTEHMCCYVA